MVLAFDKAYDHVLKIDTTNYTHFIKTDCCTLLLDTTKKITTTQKIDIQRDSKAFIFH
jgi:hypothetical protein